MLEFIPDRPALCHDRECTPDILVRITPPRPVREQPRPTIHLTLCIDRSGSMQGPKIDLARRAAQMAMRFMAPEDRLGLIIFDDHVDVLSATEPVDRTRLEHLIEGIAARGGTDLFRGWSVAADQARGCLDPRCLNRVVVLTDGETNTGETNPDVICSAVRKQSDQGLQTTTMGFGDHYNENLLRAIAASGEGNHFYVQTPDQLTRYFELELDALAATVGTRVKLGFRPLLEGVKVEPLGEVLQEGDLYQLADLVAGYPLELLFRFTVPALKSKAPPLSAVLSWHSPRSGERVELEKPLQLPSLSMDERVALPLDPDVDRHLAIALAARARREAQQAMNSGDTAAATRILTSALETQRLPEMERAQLEQLKNSVRQGDTSSSNKMFTSISYGYSRGSVVLTALDETLVAGLAQSGALPVRLGLLLQEGPPRPPVSWDRVEAMVFGIGGGEPRDLTVATLECLDSRLKLVQIMATLPRALCAAPVDDPSPALQELRGRGNFSAEGGQWTDAGALYRTPGLLVPNWQTPSGKNACLVLVGTCLTHREPVSAAACLGFAALLWDLLAMTAPPHPEFYLQRFLEAILDIELDTRLSERLKEGRWESTDQVLDVVPAALDVLRRHGHEPAAALAAADAFTAPVVGAAVGALHGGGPSDPQLASALARFAPVSA